jgi:hypothetical protein
MTQKSALIHILQLSEYFRVVDGEIFGVRLIGDCLEEVGHVSYQDTINFLHVGNDKKQDKNVLTGIKI